MENSTKTHKHDFSHTVDCEKIVCRICGLPKAEYDAANTKETSVAPKKTTKPRPSRAKQTPKTVDAAKKPAAKK